MPTIDLYVSEINDTIHVDEGEHDYIFEFNWRWHVSLWDGNDLTTPFTVPPPSARIKKTMTSPQVEIENGLSAKYQTLLGG